MGKASKKPQRASFFFPKQNAIAGSQKPRVRSIPGSMQQIAEAPDLRLESQSAAHLGPVPPKPLPGEASRTGETGAQENGALSISVSEGGRIVTGSE